MQPSQDTATAPHIVENLLPTNKKCTLYFSAIKYMLTATAFSNHNLDTSWLQTEYLVSCLLKYDRTTVRPASHCGQKM